MMPRSVAPLLVSLAVVACVILSGCGSSDEQAQQGDAPVDGLTECPDMTGRYALLHPDPETAADLTADLFRPKDRPQEDLARLESFVGVDVTSQGTHSILWRFALNHRHVLNQLEFIRESERRRYADWYALIEPAASKAYAAQYGEPALQAQLAALGPKTEVAVVLERNRDYTCENGWLVFPRDSRGPVRMTLDGGRNLIAESREISTIGVTVWCGDGCKELPIPTGTYTGVSRWPRDANAVPWKGQRVAGYPMPDPPIEIVEAALAESALQRQLEAERRFAPLDEVRVALAALVPEGIRLRTVEYASLPFKGERVHVVAVSADSAMPSAEQDVLLSRFLQTMKTTSTGYLERDEIVERVISNGGDWSHELELFLDDHPAVQRRDEARASPTFSPNEEMVAAPIGPPPTLAVLYPAAPTPLGFAELDVIKARMGPLMAEGCALTMLRFAGDAVVVSGDANDMPCVSQTLRAIDQAVPAGGARVDLMKIAADGQGRFNFELRLSASPLTKA